MRLQWLRLELRMELAADKMRMPRDFNHLYVSCVRRCAGNAEPRAGQHRFILAIELVAMPVALADLILAVDPVRQRARLYLARDRKSTRLNSSHIPLSR